MKMQLEETKPGESRETGGATQKQLSQKKDSKSVEVTDTEDYQNIKRNCQQLLDNTQQTMIKNYWLLGKHVNELKGGDRAKYGHKTVKHLAADIGKDPTTLHRAAKFAEINKEEELVPHGTNLTWGHIKVIMAVDNNTKREELRRKVESTGLSIKGLIAEVDKINGKQPRKLGPNNFESFLNRASRLYTFISEAELEEMVIEGIEDDKLEELRELHAKIGSVLEKVG